MRFLRVTGRRTVVGRSERGSAAVEFALVFPLVIMLLLTIIEFSRLWNIQATISDAAQLSARYVAIHQDDANAVTTAKAQAAEMPGLFNWSDAVIKIESACEPSGIGTVKSTITISPGSFSGWFTTALGTPIKLVAVGVTPCGG